MAKFTEEQAQQLAESLPEDDSLRKVLEDMGAKALEVIDAFAQSETYQKRIVTLINERWDIPALSETMEEATFNQLYNALQYAASLGVDELEEALKTPPE